MIKSGMQFYSSVQIQGNIDFLKYQIEKRKINLIDNTRLDLFIKDTETYLSLRNDTPI